jgi:hypothetical protein
VTVGELRALLEHFDPSVEVLAASRDPRRFVRAVARDALVIDASEDDARSFVTYSPEVWARDGARLVLVIDGAP